jgi:hypothetical protein
MGSLFEGSFAATNGEYRLEGAHHRVLAESASAPLPKRQRVFRSTDHNADTAASLQFSSESMAGVEFAQTLVTAPSEDEVLIQVSGAFEYRYILKE